VSMLLDRLQERHGFTEIVLHAISVVELEQGIYRARSPQQTPSAASIWKQFLDHSTEPFTCEIGHVVARVDAEARPGGLVIPSRICLLPEPHFTSAMA
jgi:hypothetical protein